MTLRPVLVLSKGIIGETRVFSYSRGPVLLVAETEPNGHWETLSANPDAELTEVNEYGYHLSFKADRTRIVDYASSGRNDGREFTVWIKELSK